MARVLHHILLRSSVQQRWDGSCSTHGLDRSNTYIVLIGKPQRKDHFGSKSENGMETLKVIVKNRTWNCLLDSPGPGYV